MNTPPQESALPLPILVKDAPARPKVARNPVVDEESDEALMARLRAGNPEALRTLFDRYAKLVLSIALRVLKDHGEAEDSVQESFLYIYKRADLFDPLKGSARAWIGRVALHRALDRKGYLERRGFYLNPALESVSDSLLATHGAREAKFDHAALERAFGELSESQRRTLAMYYAEELNLREIANRLNEPLGNVRHFYYRGLERLRRSASIAKRRKD